MEYVEIDEGKAQMLFHILVSITEGPQEAMGIVVRLAQLIDSDTGGCRLESAKGMSLGELLKHMADTAFAVVEKGNESHH